MRKILSIIFISGILAACQAKEVNVLEISSAAPIDVEDHTSLASVQFDRLGIKIRRGTIIGSYEAIPLGLISNCVYVDRNLFWNQGRLLSRDLEMSDIFFQTLRDANFNVVGDPNLMFASASDRKPDSDFLVGGQIEDIRLNVCEEKNFWTGRSNGTQSGKGSIKVTWQVFSKFDRKVVFETSTGGSATLKEGVAGGEIVIIQDAFASAIDNLIATKEFVDLLKSYQPDVANVRSLDATVLQFKRTPDSKMELSKRIDDIRLAVVSIDAGGGHGSGFFITPNLILTNHHVVGEAEFVRVNLLTGRKLVGDVLRSHPARDVALVQVETTGIYPLPIRDAPANIAEEVYAIGSPQSKGLSGTVTKGIVSKYLPNRRGLEDIQADVDIHAGNSGGPLLDKNGNVVGISYAGLGDSPNGFSTGLNFFIPILDALNRLRIEAVDKIPRS